MKRYNIVVTEINELGYSWVHTLPSESTYFDDIDSAMERYQEECDTLTYLGNRIGCEEIIELQEDDYSLDEDGHENLDDEYHNLHFMRAKLKVNHIHYDPLTNEITDDAHTIRIIAKIDGEKSFAEIKKIPYMCTIRDEDRLTDVLKESDPDENVLSVVSNYLVEFFSDNWEKYADTINY